MPQKAVRHLATAEALPAICPEATAYQVQKVPVTVLPPVVRVHLLPLAATVQEAAVVVTAQEMPAADMAAPQVQEVMAATVNRHG